MNVWISRLPSFIRYRFFLYAGLLPYLLGAAWAWGREGIFNALFFWTGLAGIVLAVVGVESFNEYFDARMGTDRVFNPADEENVPEWMLTLGIAAFAGAASVGLCLMKSAGWPVAVYMLLGGFAAVFYVGPPLRLAYRGLGEISIALSYGPWMTLGSLHLHTGRFSWQALAASLVPALLIASLAVANEIPDFHQDRLVGKRNWVVRLGRQKGALLYLALAALGLTVILIGAVQQWFPPIVFLGALAGFPFWAASAKAAQGRWDKPLLFLTAIRHMVCCYVAATLVLTACLLI